MKVSLIKKKKNLVMDDMILQKNESNAQEYRSQRRVNDRLNIRNILFLFGTLIAAVVLTPLYLSENAWSFWPWFWLVVSGAVTCLSITAGYHRLLAHRSYQVRESVRWVFLWIGAGAFQGSALQWCSDHRRHHAFVDSPQDPHSIKEGFFHAHMGWLFHTEPDNVFKNYPKDLLKDSAVLFQDRYYVPLAIGVGFGLPTLLGWIAGDAFGGFLFGGVLRIVLTNHSTFLINSLAHTLGTKPYDDRQTARDSWLMAVLAYGEGYHNFHHAFASDYRNGILWYQWDPTKWLIQGLSQARLAYSLRCAAPSEILRARLANEAVRFTRSGVPSERIQALRSRIEEAQSRVRKLQKDYVEMKNNVRQSSKAKLAQLKTEWKLAQVDFKAALAQWSLYRRHTASLAVGC